MLREIELERKEESDQGEGVFDSVFFQTPYLNELSELTGQVKVGFKEAFYLYQIDRKTDILEYKKQGKYIERNTQRKNRYETHKWPQKSNVQISIPMVNFQGTENDRSKFDN